MNKKRKAGDRAEAVAVRHLKSLGFEILDRNWTCRMGELDIVAVQGECLLFVEVRSVSTDYLDGPELSVTPAKQRRVASAAEIWLSQKGSQYVDIRFDVIGVKWRLGRRSHVEHIADAFVPSWAI